MAKGGWVFISHSHQDVHLVRRIRNQLEQIGFEPLMFYLKCLNDEDEIKDLIKREIDEREWFIYADSKNARKSKWVATEREYIESLSGKRVFTIDLDADPEEQLREILQIAKQMQVYISYSAKDRALYKQIAEKLSEREMLVFTDEDLATNDVSYSMIGDQIGAACRSGFVLLLITENSAKSDYVTMEIELAKKEGGKVIPVYVGKGTLSPALLPLIGDEQGISLSEKPKEEELDALVESILHRVEYHSFDFRSSCGYLGAETIHLPPISRIDANTFFDCQNLKCVHVPHSVIYITPDAFQDHKDILIKCPEGSYCQRYCEKHGLRYEIEN